MSTTAVPSTAVAGGVVASILARCRARGLTMEALAAHAATPLPLLRLRVRNAMRRTPTVDELSILAGALGCRVSDLLRD